jgi:hypothetical protein
MTVKVTKMVSETDLGYLFTILGWNLATWFAIGHIIW